MNWDDFRKAQCSHPQAAVPNSIAPPNAVTIITPSLTSAPAITERSAVFPSGISPNYTSEDPAQARMHTCLDQYNANKINDANGGMKWIQVGGGYYAECNKRLKG
jgi:hypothetical protein